MKKELFERAKTLLAVDELDHGTWKAISPLGFTDFWHSPTYYTLRQDPRLYSIFAQILNEPHLTVSLDRVCLNPPTRVLDEKGNLIADFPERRSQIFHVHNDMNLWDLSENKFQAGIALNDCLTGGFQCIPGFHRHDEIRRYREEFESGKFGEHKVPSFDQTFVWFQDKEAIAKRIVQVPMEEGDLVLWSARLPHSALPNDSAQWRIQCYIRMIPTARHPGCKPHLFSTGNPTEEFNREWEVPLHTQPETTWLGERLFGLKSWTDEATQLA